MRVAILGTGKMGAAIARRLAGEGFDLVLWNRTREKAEAVGVGEVAASPEEAAAGADVVISMLTGPAALRDVFVEGAGAVRASAGQVYLEMSTSGPAAVEELAGLVAARGATLLDAPVLGSVPAVESGSLIVLCGGSEEAMGRVRPVLDALGEVRHIGPLGSGARLKLVANSMLAGTSALAAELLAAGSAAGLPREQAFWVLSRMVPYLKARERGYVEGVHQPVLFRLVDMVKDLDLALEMFEDAGAEAPVLEEVREVFDEAAEEVGELDLSAITEHYAA
jgi:3-hydroxyisobutyrate dehydrogenase-like beta-hydroxyacid dehydrogenase